MKKPVCIKDLIRAVHQRVAKIPDAKSRAFVQQMAARLEQYGDRFCCTFKQRRYMEGLWRETRTREEKSQPAKSRLDVLRERKNNILKKQTRLRRKLNRAVNMDVQGVPLAMSDAFNSGATAKMRHSRSLQRQLHHSPLLKKTTKRG